MLKENQLKENDTFYYVLYTFSGNGEKYIVMPYQFHGDWHYMFDENLMFATKREADDKAKELNLSLRKKECF